MAKYYIKSGTFGTILDAPDISSGVQRAAYRAAKDSASVGVLVTVSETGFSLGTSSKILSFIPFLCQAGVTLPPQDELLKILSKIAKKPVKELDDSFKKWYLEGDDSFNPPL